MAAFDNADFSSMMENLTLAAGNEVYDSKIISAVNSDYKVLPGLMSSLVENASKTGKAEASTAAAAIGVFKTLANNCMPSAEPFLCANLLTLFIAAGSKQKVVREAANEAVQAITSSMGSNCVRGVLVHCFEACAVEQAWQTRVAALQVIAAFGDSCPEQLSAALPEVVPAVTPCMTDTKKQVSEAASRAMTAACDVIGNRDIEHMTTHILRSITHPNEVPEIMHTLAGVTFVQSVQSPALAMVVPLLLRGLRSRVTATRRQSAVIIDNMSKLVDDPLDAAPFLPQLLPALAKAAEEMSDPEARGVAERADNQLKRLNGLVKSIVTKGINHDLVLGAIKETVGSQPAEADTIINHLAFLACSLMGVKHFEVDEWKEVTQHLNTIVGDQANSMTEALINATKDMLTITAAADDDDDDGEELCNCTFTLAYGTKILLHNTTMRLKRGAKYGLLGGNDSGKTTLMRSIANGSVEGFPDTSEVRTVFVEADILGELSHLSCVDYIMEDERLAGLDKEEVLKVMASVGFTEDGKAKPFHAVSTLSGGWRMKLAMARAMLQKADILLLDEPTNHLDVINVAWVKNYINSLTNVTAIMVSHDTGFLNDCCTNILQIDRLKLHQFKGNLDAFIEMNPEAKAYFSLKESKLAFKFPQPGPIEGIKSRGRALMKMQHCDFTYPGNTTPTLFDISIQVSMASRVGCVGENGAGKSTMIKVLTGEVVPQTGEVWKHPNARVAYVAQHAFHHIEAHLDKTPNEYIRWRYANGEDKESLVKVSMVLTEEEEQLQKQQFEVHWTDEGGVKRKANKIVSELTGSRRENKDKEYEYEVKYKGGDEGHLNYKILKMRGWDKNCKAIDARYAQRAGLYIRTLSSSNVEKQLGDVGLEPEFASHYRMSALSGGQKVKVVIAAAMWNQPHILILDEPTNYLDRDSLGALAKAIEEYQGGVVIISHNSEFVKTLCPEEWVMDAGHLETRGEAGWMERQDEKINDQAVITEMTDASGNTTEIKKKKKALSKRAHRALAKKITDKINAGEELDEDEEEFAQENKLYEA
jgi:elongation factor 3|eukprot:CAMPEP_0113936524 /NCGR_PEP_ID=MMETSP1339-20121228/3414_1 /TAXON_ID=94617 /ORGANISM="Fibrocapsa japonica" /LENGTH=1043 /DNA_ID=CAMNT_0000939037 /DNA_START=106 /DNA_END=3237 /DNA_ORIENTATION=- /assembly_acc=CAM_ASM_000762